MPKYNDLKAINPVPSKLSQEIAAKCVKACGYEYDGGDLTQAVAAIISEVIAPLERERDEWKAKHRKEELEHVHTLLELSRKADDCTLAEAQLSSLSLAVEQLVNAAYSVLEDKPFAYRELRAAAERARTLWKPKEQP